ncbi:cytochrome P450 [Serendipita vermifera]|nr:cytochrome P450 [Serendipita vermifera]
MEVLTNRLADSSYIEIVGVSLLAASALYVCSRAFSGPKHKVVYPPGPPKDPLIGNLRQFPKDNWWSVFNQWQKEYGDIVFLDVPSLPFVIVNSLDVAQELLSKRASSTSGRKVGYMCQTMMSFQWSFGFRQADATHQNIKKLFRIGMGPNRVSNHDALVLYGGYFPFKIWKAILSRNYCSISIGEFIVSLAYGRHFWDAHGPELAKLNNEAMDLLTRNLAQFWLVDIFRWMRFIASWMPGADRQGIYSTRLTTRIREWSYAESVKLFNSGTLDHSLVNDLLEEYGPSEDVKDALVNIYGAGNDTTTCTISLFLSAIFMFPDVAKKIQEELTSVVGDERLPSVKDRTKLPYTEAA